MLKHVSLVISFGALAQLAFASPAAAVGLNGTWTASDTTGSLTRLIITSDASGRSSLHGFGRCTPECDWGTAPLTTYGSAVTDASAIAGTAVFASSGESTTVAVQLSSPGTLQVDVFTRFIDNSGRKNYLARQVLRQPLPPGAVSPLVLTTSERNASSVFTKYASPRPTIAGSTENANPPSGAGKGTILSDGSVEVTYPDGTKKIYSKGGVTTITPDGKSSYRSYTNIELQAQPPTPPSVPDSETSKWADQEASMLLTVITALVANDKASIHNLLAKESQMTWYEKIDHRTSVVQTLSGP